MGWWLWCHLAAQSAILEKQIQVLSRPFRGYVAEAEAAAVHALKARAKYVPRASSDESQDEA